MKKSLIYFLLLFSFNAVGQDRSLFKKEWFIQNGDTMPYRILFPVNYEAAKAYPLLIFLHGRGESGRDNIKQLTHVADLFLSDSIRTNYPAIIVVPQCSSNSYWSNVHIITKDSTNTKRDFYFIPDGMPSRSMALLLGLVENIFVRYRINAKRVYLGGLSMGGMGTFELARRLPNTFAAAFAICGGAHPVTANQIRKTSWWIFHGLKDDIVDPEFSKKIAHTLKQQGAKVKLSLYPNANHNSWDAAFAEKDLMRWLFSHKL